MPPAGFFRHVPTLEHIVKKLKLEALEVTSFETSSTPSMERGTVQGLAAPQTRNCPPATYNIDACGDTQYFDCTLGCSYLMSCNGCTVVGFTELDCAETADCPTV